MTDPRETLARIRKQADAATDGPWEAEGGFVEPTRSDLPTIVECSDPEEHDVNNAEFIAAARTAVPWLLEQVERRDKALDSVLDMHKPTRGAIAVCYQCVYSAWPCPTVEAITRALEGETND